MVLNNCEIAWIAPPLPSESLFSSVSSVFMQPCKVLDLPRRDQNALFDRVRRDRHRENQRHRGDHCHLLELSVSQKAPENADHINGANHIAD